MPGAGCLPVQGVQKKHPTKAGGVVGGRGRAPGSKSARRRASLGACCEFSENPTVA